METFLVIKLIYPVPLKWQTIQLFRLDSSHRISRLRCLSLFVGRPKTARRSLLSVFEPVGHITQVHKLEYCCESSIDSAMFINLKDCHPVRQIFCDLLTKELTPLLFLNTIGCFEISWFSIPSSSQNNHVGVHAAQNSNMNFDSDLKLTGICSIDSHFEINMAKYSIRWYFWKSHL